jgi:hypothetical protein
MDMIENIKMAYKSGISFREKLTDYSSDDLKAMLDKIATYGVNHLKFKDSMEYYDDRKLSVVYGREKNGDGETIHFILSSATLSWGGYDTWKAEINAFGIFVKYKPEHGTEENVFAIEWHLFNDLKTLFE